MANSKNLKEIAKCRIKSAKILLDGKDWHLACYTMGFVLECALKSCICKTLRIEDYPESHKDKKVPDFFMTHTFDRLLLLSGLNDVFSISGDSAAFNSWSQFTVRYPGDWVSMRYTVTDKQFDESTAKLLYKSLYEDKNSVIKVITNKKRW